LAGSRPVSAATRRTAGEAVAGAAAAGAAEEVEHGLGLGESEAHLAGGEHINQIVGREGVDALALRGGGVGFLPETVDDAGARERNIDGGWDDRVKPEGGALQLGPVGLQEVDQILAEFIEGEVGEGDGLVEVFEIEHFVLEALELTVAKEQIVFDELFELGGIEEVVGLGGGEVYEGHAGLDAVFDAEVFVEVGDGPEIDELHGVVARADAVDAAKALDDANGVPVDVVVYEQIAVLKILTLADTVGGDEQVDLFALVGESDGLFGAALSEGSEVGEDVVVVGATEGGGVAAIAANETAVDAEFGMRPVGEMLVEVARGVGKGGEDDDLAVGFAVAVDGG
jgi:hypothetical protein